MGFVMALYVARIVSFCLPHVVDVSIWSICIVLRAFVVVISMCMGSRVSPSIFGLMFMGSVMWSIYSSRCVLYIYNWMFAFAMFMSLCIDVMVISSAYVVSFTGACGVRVSYVYMLKSVGDWTPPYGTPVLNWRCVDVFFSGGGVCFAAFNVVCDEFDNGVWDVCLV